MTTHLVLVNKRSKQRETIYVINVNISLTTYPPVTVYVIIEWPLIDLYNFLFINLFLFLF